MTELLLSRTLDPADYAALSAELAVVDAHSLDGQHPHRRWEYALALHAVTRWMQRGKTRVHGLYDVGGAGSSFAEILHAHTRAPVEVIDPRAADPATLEEFCGGGAPLAEIITCLSVIEHVDDVDHFVYLLACLLAPGGLLVLTMDYWNRCGPDTAKNHTLRKRLFCPKSYRELRQTVGQYQLTVFGGVDPLYHGAHVFDYSFASLVLEKRR